MVIICAIERNEVVDTKELRFDFVLIDCSVWLLWGVQRYSARSRITFDGSN